MNEDKFIKFVFNKVCQCYNQCIKLDKKFVLNDEAEFCNKIELTNNDKHDDFINTITHSINAMKNLNYLKQIGNKYYIIINNNKIRLTWENIKNIDDENIKKVFWLFRKIIVDSFLKYLLQKIKSDNYMTLKKINNYINIYSVGSTNLTSDYDITLYCITNKYIAYIIEKFQQKFKNIFFYDSAIVFDTNIYGKAYIQFHEDNYYNKFTKCISQKQQFYYLQSYSSNSPVIWAFIKYIRNFKDAFGENMYNDYYNFLKSKIDNNTFFYNSLDTLLLLNNFDNNYTNLLIDEDNFKKIYQDNKIHPLQFYNDYISLINYYGIETYFTRGAFLDTVVNLQMCKNDTPAIKLTTTDYISSILENSGFFFIHNNKVKYIKRVVNSIKLLSHDEYYSNIIETNDFQNLEQIVNNEKNYCNWIKHDILLLNCKKFMAFQNIFSIIFFILRIFLTHNQNITFPFLQIYKNYIEQNGGIVNLSPIKTSFNSTDSLNFS